MALTSKQAFEYGFLVRCAEESLTPAETQARIKKAHAVVPMLAVYEKQAYGQALGSLVGGVGSTAAKLLMMGIPLSMVAGGGLGYLAGSSAGQDLPDPEELKQRELSQAYSRHAEDMERATKRQRRRRQERPALAAPGLF